jgi:nucleotide-binding universal stress UspA family protein
MGSQLSVLVGVDGEEGGWVALRHAADLAQRLDAHLHVAHVVAFHAGIAVPVGPAPAVPMSPMSVGDPSVDARECEHANDLTAKHLAGHPGGWDFHSAVGDPGQVLGDLAEELDAYCVVVGSRGAGFAAFMERLLRPSVSQELIRHRHRPVLVVSPHHD